MRRIGYGSKYYVLTAVRSHAYIPTLHAKKVQNECVNECVS